jgi:glycosyltransferase involved in cell wall biosynthesis
MGQQIIVSNGFGRFHMRLAAVEAGRRDALAAFVTGAYPTPGLAGWLTRLGLAERPAIARFLARAEPVPEGREHALWAGEPFSQLGSRARSVSLLRGNAADRIHLTGRALYACGAARIVSRLDPPAEGGVYHYRAGFGGRSVAAARARGWVCLCDHTIAHPAVLEYLVAHAGNMPPPGEAGPIDENWRAILADIDRADHVLTNSDFVKSTFVQQNWGPDRVDVIYLGIDDGFLSAIPARVPREGPLRLLFAGAFNRRKGGPELAEALLALDGVDWRLDLCGPVGPDSQAAFDRLAADSRVTCHGNLSAGALAARMAAADVFVFPTLAEGSARVLFEALAAGCYVVTTPNGGSIVADGEHGRLIAPARGTATMHISASADSSSLLPITDRQAELFPGTEEVGTTDVEAGPLEAFVAAGDLAAPALLKIDVQGFELEVLRGSRALLPAFAYVYVEASFEPLYAGQALAGEVVAFLEESGFEEIGRHNLSRGPGGDPVQADFLFRRGPAGDVAGHGAG